VAERNPIAIDAAKTLYEATRIEGMRRIFNKPPTNNDRQTRKC